MGGMCLVYLYNGASKEQFTPAFLVQKVQLLSLKQNTLTVTKKAMSSQLGQATNAAKITFLGTFQKNLQLSCINLNDASQFPFKLILLNQARLHQHRDQHL